MRPVCSDCASLPHALGQWIDEQLQPIVQQQHTYFRDTFDLKQRLDALRVLPGTSLFMYDTVPMYTNIGTQDCPERLRHNSVPWSARLPSCTSLSRRSSKIKFGDIYLLQLIDITMGMSPTPTIANLCAALHELSGILPWLQLNLFYRCRFIDGGFRIWVHNPDPDIDT
ncbi:hypothetical protein ACHAWF_004623 [Thalassiosira exigua]